MKLNKSINDTKVAVFDYERKYKSIFDKSILTLFLEIRSFLSHKIKTIFNIRSFCYKPSLSNEIMISDSYLAPIDVSFDTLGLKKLIEEANLEVIEFLSLGRMDKTLLPKSWIKPWDNLKFWQKVQVMEIVDPAPTSWSIICRKKKK